MVPDSVSTVAEDPLNTAEEYVKLRRLGHQLIPGFWIVSPQMNHIDSLIQRVAPMSTTVLVSGETGVGKELVAKSLHDLNPRRKSHPFVVVDCGILNNQELINTQLFGSVKGAYTGSVADVKGLLEVADEGTLFIDEITDLPLPMQGVFLRFLQNREYLRVGDNKYQKSNARIVVGTNGDLSEAVCKRRFREDLYHRLNVVRIHVPPLRERPKDIETLTSYFLQRLGFDITAISASVLKQLRDHSWPGNVRELETTLERSAIGQIVNQVDVTNVLRSILIDQSQLTPSQNQVQCQENRAGESLDETQKRRVREALEKCFGIQKYAAEELGISPRALNYVIKKWGWTEFQYQKKRGSTNRQ